MNECYFGDCRSVMQRLAVEQERVQTVVTSPPYWGLRDYGTAPIVFGADSDCAHQWVAQSINGNMRLGMGLGASSAKYRHIPSIDAERAHCARCGAWRGHLGLEAIHDCLAWARNESPCHGCYVCHLRTIFAHVHDILVDDGTLWLNLGDSYASGGSGEQGVTGQRNNRRHTQKNLHRGSRKAATCGSKSKDLHGIPWRIALALQADGWYLRQDIIWAKPNPMPESVRDRCTKAHEYLFLLAKSPRYYFDQDAIKDPARWNREKTKMPDGWDTGAGAHGVFHRHGREKGRRVACAQHGVLPLRRNKRSVWSIATQPYKGSHFATFAPTLVEPCVLAGSRAGDIVFDPFMGSGMIAQVAQGLGRRWLGCELDERCRELQAERLTGTLGFAL